MMLRWMLPPQITPMVIAPFAHTSCQVLRFAANRARLVSQRAFQIVNAGVLTLRNDLEILRPVVGLNAVDVVNVFLRRQKATDDRLHYNAMLQNVPVLVGMGVVAHQNIDIPAGDIPSIPKAIPALTCATGEVTRTGTELGLVVHQSGRLHAEGSAALLALALYAIRLRSVLARIRAEVTRSAHGSGVFALAAGTRKLEGHWTLLTSGATPPAVTAARGLFVARIIPPTGTRMRS